MFLTINKLSEIEKIVAIKAHFNNVGKTKIDIIIGKLATAVKTGICKNTIAFFISFISFFQKKAYKILAVLIAIKGSTT